MSPVPKQDVAFDRPGGESCAASSQRPIDMAHLAQQTMGDRALEQEILQLFAHQAASVCKQLAEASAQERVRLAHGLKGSARGVGAFAVADCVALLENQPTDQAILDKLVRLVDQACDFISAINR